MTKTQRTLEIFWLTALMLLTLTAICWGPPSPPDPPSTPIANPVMTVVTIVTMAGYGFWKMRK